MLRGEDFRTVRADGGEIVWLRPELTAILVEREEQHRLEEPAARRVRAGQGQLPLEVAVSQLFDPDPPRAWTPWQLHSKTSEDAAFAIKRKAPSIRERVYQALCERPMTDEELCETLEMGGSTIRPRRIELHQAHRITEAGTRKTHSGRDAVVWKITEAGA